MRTIFDFYRPGSREILPPLDLTVAVTAFANTEDAYRAPHDKQAGTIGVLQIRCAVCSLI
jgi:hypothetical protein